MYEVWARGTADMGRCGSIFPAKRRAAPLRAATDAFGPIAGCPAAPALAGAQRLSGVGFIGHSRWHEEHVPELVQPSDAELTLEVVSHLQLKELLTVLAELAEEAELHGEDVVAAIANLTALGAVPMAPPKRM